MFILDKELTRESLDWGKVATISGPLVNGARDIVTLVVHLEPGKGHAFHHHPNQEEVIYVLEGQVEQWVAEQKTLLGVGDAAFIGAGVVHASFNVGTEVARLLAILGPSVGTDGYEVVEVADQEPWINMR